MAKISRVPRVLALVVAPAIAGLALAGAANADPALLNGVYGSADGDPYNVLSITTGCGPAGCAGTVTSNQGWTTPTTFSDGRWNFTVTKPGGLTCEDGHYEPAVVSLSVDPVTLAGISTSDSNYGCAGGVLTQSPFQLQKVG
ncbi:hypothetical protein ACN27E_15465 [Mycobacterium sp. WMMD1722]|uniref:hypothetical protein n=1 Tax=Mycobacterium sp. WMMD1722 TaxID=3404117 RepID=UPI003BF5503E